ncbi:MAG: ABC transporter ATP-binding protein [Rubrivivax sp.]
MSYLLLDHLHIAYGRAAAVHDLNLGVGRGELVSLLGPSGCGKTTTMRAIAGLLPARSGRIVLDGEDITTRPAHQRNLGLVFQSYALFPHLTAYENVAFGLRLRQVAAAELQQRVEGALAAVGLADFAQRLPARLSGGQQQRVALARAIVLRPRLLLLDEPLSNLDAKLRVEMRAELRRIQRELGITMLYVTHDQDEALSLSDRIVILRDGRIEQDASPEQLFHHPATAFVAGFMGYDNLFEHAGRQLAWRPEQVAVLAAGGADGEPGVVKARSYLGERVEYLVHTARGAVKGVGPGHFNEGDAVCVRLDPARAAVIGGA